MKVPKFLRGYGNDPYEIDLGAVCLAITSVFLFLSFGGILVLLVNYFATTTFTGPCAGAGGVGTYAVDYVQCANGKRVIYERATVDSHRYGLHITNGGR